MRGDRNNGGGGLRENGGDAGIPGTLSRIHAWGSIADGLFLESVASAGGRLLVRVVLRMVAGARVFRRAGVLHRRRLRARNSRRMVHNGSAQRLSGLPVEPGGMRGTALGRAVVVAFGGLATVAALSGCAGFQTGKPAAPVLSTASVQSAAPARPLTIRSRWFLPISPVAGIEGKRMPFVEPLPKARPVPKPAIVQPARATAHPVAQADPWHCRVAKPECPKGGGKEPDTNWWVCRKTGAKSVVTGQSAARITGIGTAHFLPRGGSFPGQDNPKDTGGGKDGNRAHAKIRG